jgi:glycosyltransferase involved in cell wall biosynthesis
MQRLEQLNIIKLDDREILQKTEEIRAFICVRNEILRLPWVLEYHRKIGVTRFIVLDNGSTDGSREYLLSQKDVHCFSTYNSYAKSLCGIIWINGLLDAFGIGHWCLVIDADEMLIYDSFEIQQLPYLTQKLDKLGFRAVLARVIDMYSAKSIRNTIYKKGESFLNACPYFDVATYRIIRTSYFPSIEVYGGPRERVFWATNDIDFHSPTMSAIPLIKWQDGFAYTGGRHFIHPVMNIAIFAGAILHFKFFSDFYVRIEEEVARGEHFAEAREYRVYRECLKDNLDLTLYYPESELFINSKQLVTCNFLKNL